MKKTIAFLALSFTLGGVSSEALSDTSFFDDFNRPDSQTVGNGWLDAPDTAGNHLSIKGGQLTTFQSFSGIYRPFSFSSPVSISATLAETSGFGGLLESYRGQIGILNDGTRTGGYRVGFNRSDQNFNNSNIELLDGSNVIATFFPQIQFGHQIDIQLRFGINGSVIGSIGQNGQSESFSFGPYSVLSSGRNVFIGLGGADGRGTSNPTQHRLDNFSITAIPEPLTVAIDIKPGSFPNSINPKSKGKIPVAILSTANFNAPASVDMRSLTFGRSGNEASLAHCGLSFEDVNGDFLADLVCHFNTQTAAFQSGDTQGVLKGKTTTGTPLAGSDSVRIVPPQ